MLIGSYSPKVGYLNKGYGMSLQGVCNSLPASDRLTAMSSGLVGSQMLPPAWDGLKDPGMPCKAPLLPNSGITIPKYTNFTIHLNTLFLGTFDNYGESFLKSKVP